MHYRPAEDLLRLALALQGTAEGLTVKEIERRLGCSRSTVLRMLEVIAYVFPQLEEGEPDGRAKRWRIPAGTLNRMIAFDAAELKELEGAADRLRAEGLDARAAVLDRLRGKLQALRPAPRGDAGARLELLLQAEHDAVRPGPRPTIPDGLLETLRAAIALRRVLTLRYRSRVSGRRSTLALEPHGILFGTRHYLVAFKAGDPLSQPRLFALSNMAEPALSAERFAPRQGFDLRAFAARSFGVFQEDPVEVVWRFAPSRAADAMEHHFHATQTKRLLPDGSAEVRFTAGGMVEMCWHLFTWGDAVEVVAPDALRALYAELLGAALRHVET